MAKLGGPSSILWDPTSEKRGINSHKLSSDLHTHTTNTINRDLPSAAKLGRVCVPENSTAQLPRVHPVYFYSLLPNQTPLAFETQILSFQNSACLGISM